ncbi:DUF3108 domain-containing protein [Shewanella schlegeliana]|uniref:DUF3108 domain-containing protein n=1 Tax=Shewanella schlegeliana TaxID=190308 RepID=A0ABS1SUC5_9GAMM|nr:DUF3108 domain-containing protein [Shewanella schlegeliana]MBL4911994.1 DUF3108 domain-containing protein [Shewanella schlegeliana]MCL1111630.1 DUF3108 domain-containing protein [Shewanella schlegeliana]GIU35255.1 hypothetical protein TUM4433_32400 [Shewanella schlegeliana]
MAKKFPTLFAISLLFASSSTLAETTALTPHTAEYQVNYGSIELGRARYILDAPQGNFFQYRFDSDIGLLMLSDKRHIRSDFTLEDDNQLVPMRYSVERTGTGPSFREQAAFAKGQNVVHSRYKEERAQFPYDNDLFDPLMVQLQFRLDMQAHKDELHYTMVKEGEVDDYAFKIVGKERVNIDSGSYQTIKFEVVRDSKKRQTFFWMAPELSYLPIRLTHFEKGSKQLDIKLLNYRFEPTSPTNTPATKQAQLNDDASNEEGE